MFKYLNQLAHKLILSPLAYEIWISFKYSPDVWEGYLDDHRVCHKTNGTRLWTGNGAWYFTVEHERERTKLLGNLDRHIVWLAFRKARRNLKNASRYSLRNDYIKRFASNKNKTKLSNT